MAEATSNDPTPSVTEPFITNLVPELPVTVDNSTITLTDNLLTQYLNAYPESNRRREQVILACLSIVLRQTDQYVPDHILANASRAAVTTTGENGQNRRDSQFSQVTEKSLHRARTHITNELSIPLAPTRPADHASEAYRDDTIPNDIVGPAIDFIDRVPAKVYSGAKPSCVFAGSLYAIGLTHPDIDNLTQREVADALDTSQVSIRNNFHKLVETDVEPIPDS